MCLWYILWFCTVNLSGGPWLPHNTWIFGTMSLIWMIGDITGWNFQRQRGCSREDSLFPSLPSSLLTLIATRHAPTATKKKSSMAQAASTTLYWSLENMYLKPIALSITIVFTREVRVFVSFAVVRVADGWFLMVLSQWWPNTHRFDAWDLVG